MEDSNLNYKQINSDFNTVKIRTQKYYSRKYFRNQQTKYYMQDAHGFPFSAYDLLLPFNRYAENAEDQFELKGCYITLFNLKIY